MIKTTYPMGQNKTAVNQKGKGYDMRNLLLLCLLILVVYFAGVTSGWIVKDNKIKRGEVATGSHQTMFIKAINNKIQTEGIKSNIRVRIFASRTFDEELGKVAITLPGKIDLSLLEHIDYRLIRLNEVWLEIDEGWALFTDLQPMKGD